MLDTFLLLPYALWGSLYIFRTSFVIDGSRVFCLWDDAMISMRYASNLFAGDGLVWNPGEEPVQGITNLGVTLVMAALHFLPVETLKLAAVVQVLNLVGQLACIVLIWRIALAAFENRSAIAIGAALGVAMCAPFASWGLQGSDTTAVALWILVGLRWLAQADGRWPRQLFPWLALGMLIRLDTAVFCGVFWLASCAYPGHVMRRLAIGAASFALVGVALLCFSTLYYGDPLPNTYYLKLTGVRFSLMLQHAWLQLALWKGALPAVILAGCGLVRFRNSRLALLSAGLVAAAVFYHLRTGGDWAYYYGSRHLVPAMPLLLMLSAAGLWAVCERILPQRLFELRKAQAAVVALSLVPVLLTNTDTSARDWFDPGTPTMYREENKRNAKLALYFRDNTPATTTLAVHWAGVPTYFSGRPGIDVLGKSDPYIAKMEVTSFEPGHSKWDWQYVLGEKKPDIFLSHSRGLADQRLFRTGYYRVTTPDGLDFYLRKQSLDLLTDPDVVLEDLVTGDRFPRTAGAADR
jgi:hypothetical protein